VALRLVVGLGNPGRRYQGTRHNIGFLVLDELRRRVDAPEERERSGALRSEARLGDREIVLVRPVQFMNLSGPPVRAAIRERGAEPDEALVVCDDVWLPFGALRLRRGGSHGGHNGLRSIIDSLGSGDFPRLRVGIGQAPEGQDQAEYVLERFALPERRRLDEVIGAAADAVETAVTSGIDAAMNRTNRRPAAAETEN
jgi:PTH1 family peptidyl-tRNA hydrolase